MPPRPLDFSPAPTERAVAALIIHARRLARRHWRRLVWLSGEPAAARQAAAALWQAQAWRSPLWVGSASDSPSLEALAPRKARSRLGGEHQLVVLDASGKHGFDPDALGVLAGTLTAGGLCVLITPTDWGTAPDPDYARLSDHPWTWQGLEARYLARLAGILSASPAVARWPLEGRLYLPRLGRAPRVEPDAEQARVAALVGRLKRRRPLVITADRGRGKSAALGMGCARLLEAGVSNVTVTAPSPAAVASLFERLAALCPSAQREGPTSLVLPSGQRAAFVSPQALDDALTEGSLGGDGSVLLVDEAAALPAAALARWLAAFPRIAFATTVHGYEGSGRGFALRFRAVLDRCTPLWREVSLETPIRFAPDDPLEATLETLLLLKAPLPRVMPGAVSPRAITQAALARRPALLERAFGLLVQSHYRTTPADLRQLLDGPSTALRLIETNDEPQAVLVTREEGGFDHALADAVARGERRPRGHLLAQSLAAHGGSRAALTARWRRVARVAVHPERRREGLGRALIEADIEAARAAGVSLYGATFGAEAGLLRFWRALDFTPVRLGVTREAATGEYAIMVARALDAEGAAVLEELSAAFGAALPGHLAFELAGLDADVVTLVLAALTDAPLGALRWRDVEDVAYAHRDPALARPALQALVRAAARHAGHEEMPAGLGTLAAWAFQNAPPVKAPREAVGVLRQALRAVLAHSFPGRPGAVE
ncbi:GNAT family N-acetyltransferase [Vreelandella malpeensis]|uniref:tRNA(Met) cytidine acetyltransferase TmcA n=1 Tax=Vreelandella malpeensis TaxID=1172368 RepID=A0ABS8DPD1_9GAMM|nr:GNAT family N-acetyltransferase [Halomonas malpeensis]MCB8888131.1 tRNA(Met) cytidine acetyltransferase [Halomonas malpeensis]